MRKIVFAVLVLFSLALLLNINNVSAANVTADQVVNASGTVKSYVETNHALPSSVDISGTQVNMPQFLEISTTTVLNINSSSNETVAPKNLGAAPAPSETMTSGVINSTEYIDIANRVKSYMGSNGRAPNYASSSLGKIRYESLVYIYSQILDSYNTEGVLPDFVMVDSWAAVSNTNNAFYSIDQVNDASSRVKSFIEVNHRLPNYVTMSGKQVNMPQFLKIATTTLLNTISSFHASTVLESYGSAPSPEETIKSKSMDLSEYIDVAARVKLFMDVYKRAPDYAQTSFGNMGFESLVYTYSQLMNYYNSTNYLPTNITVNPWSVISNSNTVFFTKDQINSAAGTVKSYIESNHVLPSDVTISGKQVSMPQFLKLSTESLLDIAGTLQTSFVPGNCGAASDPSETMTSGNIDSDDYVDIATRVNSFMCSEGRAPNYATSDQGNIRYESLVYMYSQILNSYTATNGTLPNYIAFNPWTVVSNQNTVFLNMDQVISTSGTVKSYIELNHALPNDVTISGKQVSMPQFLKLAARSVMYIDENLFTSIVLENVGNAPNPTENMTVGDITTDEFVEMANVIKSYMDTNGTAPNYVTNIVLRTSMRYESLIYMYSQVLNSYNSTTGLPDQITVTPWLAISNPDKTYNFRTQKMFNSIQAAVDDIDTLNGDDIWLGKGTISENVIISKSLTIKPIYGLNVTVQALDPNLPVFTITSSGNSSTITNLVINGSTSNSGIYIDNSSDITISENTLSNNVKGIYLNNSTDNEITENTIIHNTGEGVFINNCTGNTISDNAITYNGLSGIKISSSLDNAIYSNTLSNNSQHGISIFNSSVDVNFNRIIGNSIYGLYNEGNGTIDATNNWWGSNNPIVSLNGPSDIGIQGGTVNYDPYLVMTINSSCDRSNRTNTTYSYTITADLTHNNQGNNTSSDGNIPDEVPVNFSTTFGTINTSVSTRKGKAMTTFNSTAAGTANVSVTLDKQTLTIPVNITEINALGIFNNRTNEVFSTIQAAIDDVDTLNGDTILLGGGTYTENVIITKKLTIKPVSGENVTIQSADEDTFIFVISSTGNGSMIQGLNIIGNVDTFGILLCSASDCNITGNTITDNEYGIYLGNSTNNCISGNTIRANWNAIYLQNSNNNTISGNSITNSWDGLCIDNSNGTVITGNTITYNNWDGIKIEVSNGTVITGNTITDNGGGIHYLDSNGTVMSENNVTDNWNEDISQIDSTGIVMASSVVTCGPAALATVMKNLGVNATEDELVGLAGTDLTGTTMYGLLQAAQSKGLIAKGIKLTVGELRMDNIVLLSINGEGHYIIIKNITNGTVYLADTSLGNMEMTLEKFTELYSGNALVITNDASNAQLNNSNVMTTAEMKLAKGQFVPFLIYAAVVAAPIVIRMAAPVVCRVVVQAAVRYGPRIMSYGSRLLRFTSGAIRSAPRVLQYGANALRYTARTFTRFGSKSFKSLRNGAKTLSRYPGRTVNYITKRYTSLKKVAKKAGQNVRTTAKAKKDAMYKRVEKGYKRIGEIYKKNQVDPYIQYRSVAQKGYFTGSRGSAKQKAQNDARGTGFGNAAANSKAGHVLGYLRIAFVCSTLFQVIKYELTKDYNKTNTTNTSNTTMIQQHQYNAT